MLHYIEIHGVEFPVDLSIRTITKLAKHYNTDITGFVQMITDAKDVDSSLDVIETLGTMVLNDGAERANTGNSFTVFDIRDYVTADPHFAENLTTLMLDTFEQGEVFQKPPVAAAPKKAKK